jgi:hypothetical protein
MACKNKINKFVKRVQELDLNSVLPQIKCSPLPASKVAPNKATKIRINVPRNVKKNNN